MIEPCRRPAGRRGRRCRRRAPSCALDCRSVPCAGGGVGREGKREEIRVLLLMESALVLRAD